MLSVEAILTKCAVVVSDDDILHPAAGCLVLFSRVNRHYPA